jgi:glucosamine 6-phosphate synthetase-like amidotransferase/phosphosugar isomerase protein
MSCTVRIELHNAVYSDYEILHEEMKKKGFSRYITSDTGIKYHLPEAEYNISGSNRSDILALAKAAAQVTRKSFGILVTESNGLEIVKTN